MTLNSNDLDFLPGRLSLEPGAAADYRALARFHYAAGPPATWAAVCVARFAQRRQDLDFDDRHPHTVTPLASRVVAVAVLSWPKLSCRARQRHFHLGAPSDPATSGFINRNLRTISRVIVHPQFRGLGLGSALVRRVCEQCDTRYVEAIAQMGHVHPLFELAGLTRLNADHPHEAPYYLLDRVPPAPGQSELPARRRHGSA